MELPDAWVANVVFQPWLAAYGRIPIVNEAQKRRIASTFEHVDELLQAAVSAMDGGHVGSPFNRFILDSDQEQQRRVEDEVQNIRGLMVAAMDRLGIPVPVPSVSAIRSAQSDLLFAEVDIEDIEPKRLRGYGALPPEEAKILSEINSGLVEALARINERLKPS